MTLRVNGTFENLAIKDLAHLAATSKKRKQDVSHYFTLTMQEWNRYVLYPLRRVQELRTVVIGKSFNSHKVELGIQLPISDFSLPQLLVQVSRSLKLLREKSADISCDYGHLSCLTPEQKEVERSLRLGFEAPMLRTIIPQGIFYEMQRDGKVVGYLYGSVHNYKENWKEFRPEVVAQMTRRSTTHVYFETDHDLLFPNVTPVDSNTELLLEEQARIANKTIDALTPFASHSQYLRLGAKMTAILRDQNSELLSNLWEKGDEPALADYTEEVYKKLAKAGQAGLAHQLLYERNLNWIGQLEEKWADPREKFCPFICIGVLHLFDSGPNKSWHGLLTLLQEKKYTLIKR